MPPRIPSHRPPRLAGPASDGPPRRTAAQRGYGARWQKARLRHLAGEPLCRACRTRGVVTPATVVDHVVPHRGDAERFWDESNLQSLCVACHNAKTARGE